MRMILFFLISAVIMVNCSSPVRSIEEVVAMDKEIHLRIITYTDYFPFFIQYKNIGEKDLLIENIDTGCGCIINETFFQSVVPGDSAYINLAFKPQSGGYVERRMAIYFQGYDNPLDITVKAFAVDSVR